MKKSFILQTLLWCLVLGLSVATFAQQKTRIDGNTLSAAQTQNNSQSQSNVTDATIIRWDNGTNFDAIGLTSGGTFEVSARFPASLMGTLAGQSLTQVEIYINDLPAPCTIKIYDQGTPTSPGTLLYSETVTPISVSWNLLTLGTPVPVSGNDIWIGYEVTHTAGFFPCGVDPGPAQADGDWIYLAPGPWAKLSVIAPSLNYNWNIAGYVESLGGPGPATNPSPANGATGIPITGNTASWTNPAGVTSCAVWFGPAGNMTQVYTGSPITSIALPVLNYGSVYNWRVDETDGSGTTFGSVWSFTTVQDPSLITVTVDVYPQNLDYWTGTCSASSKTQVSLVNAVFNDVGWMAFDISSIVNDPTTVIESIEFNGYLYANNWPYWSITPMGSVNPITGTASEINTQVSTNYDEGIAYSYNTEAGTMTNGWLSRPLETTAPADLKNALGQGWFAIGIVDWDFSATFYVNFEGWAETNRPYLTVTYSYIVPVELTSFTATGSEGLVELRWITATETNNQGFEVQKSAGGEFETIAFVEGHGTTTETQAYTFADRNVNVGTYSYRLKQIDFGGTFEYSDVVAVDVPAPSVFALDQNYPNPFNPSTKIAFRLAVDSRVNLKVFDVLGQEVASLVNTNLVAGSHSIDFNASSLNSGVYLYRIEATGINGLNFVDVKKMILTK